MNNLNIMKDQKFVFGSVQIVANKMDTLLERELKEYGLTSKQWFMTVVIENSFEQPPTIKEVAKVMGSSHQNVKQVALKLQQKGMVVLEKDNKDSRVTRIRLTEHCQQFANVIATKAARFTQTLFEGIDDQNMAVARIVLQQMMDNLTEMEEAL